MVHPVFCIVDTGSCFDCFRAACQMSWVSVFVQCQKTFQLGCRLCLSCFQDSSFGTLSIQLADYTKDTLSVSRQLGIHGLFVSHFEVCFGWTICSKACLGSGGSAPPQSLKECLTHSLMNSKLKIQYEVFDKQKILFKLRSGILQRN